MNEQDTLELQNRLGPGVMIGDKGTCGTEHHVNSDNFRIKPPPVFAWTSENGFLHIMEEYWSRKGSWISDIRHQIDSDS